MIKKVLIINGVERTLVLEGNETLAKVLRERLLLTGCKIGCGEGHCGACNVIVDGKVTRSCITKVMKLRDYAEITTIEGIGTVNNLHPIQVAWMAYGCAQCGFCSPGFIVSAKVLLEQNPNPTRAEVRDWFNKNRNLCRCTGYKPLIDATMAAAAVMRGEMSKEDLLFKPTENVITGTTYARPSAAMKVTGTWDFGADQALTMPESTLRLALVQAEVSHANIKSVDTSEAEKMPGVFKVITAKDVPGKNRINGLVMLPLNNKCDGWDRPILCDEKIFQYGDAIAIVAADTEAHAREAAKAVKVDLEVLPAYMSVPEALAPDAIEIHPGTPNAYYETNCIKGPDFDFDSAPNVIEVESYCSRQPHLYLEPDNGYAYIDEDGMLTVHSKSIGIHLHMPMIADGIGVTMDKLRLVQNHTGGTFGYKFSPTNEAILGVAALVCQRPVSLNFNMYQSITYTGKRSPGFMHIKLAADNNGKVLAAAVNLDVIAAVKKTENGVIRLKSVGFPMDTVDTADLNVQEVEKECSASLIRGVCARLKALGYEVGGFDAVTTSRVLKGSGLSSSAAFEVLVVTILSHLYNDDAIDPVEAAQISKFAENVYFGKPSGLLDQMAASVGGFTTMDFKDLSAPKIEKIDFDLDRYGYALCVVDTGGNHADLTGEYAAIPAEMKRVAKALGGEVLREVSEEEFYKKIPELRKEVGDRAILRAIHFFDDNRVVDKEVAALKAGDFETFKQCVIASGHSSAMNLQNVFAVVNPQEQGLSLALALIAKILGGKGAYRVHGGGFAGTVQAYVPLDMLDAFKAEMQSVFGERSCYVLSVRSAGGTKVTIE